MQLLKENLEQKECFLDKLAATWDLTLSENTFTGGGMKSKIPESKATYLEWELFKQEK